MAKSTKVKRIVATVAILVLGFSITLFVMMLLSIVTDYGITIASFGATVLMILGKKSLSKKKIFGAYLLTSFIGCLGSLLPTMTSFNIAITTIISLAALTMFDLQHAPAVGIAISMVLNKFPLWIDFVVISCILVIIGIAILVQTYMKDPDKIMNLLHIETEKIKWDF